MYRLHRPACLEHIDVCCTLPMHILRVGLIWWAQVYISRRFSLARCAIEVWKLVTLKRYIFRRSQRCSLLLGNVAPSLLRDWCRALPDSVVASSSRFERLTKNDLMDVRPSKMRPLRYPETSYTIISQKDEDLRCVYWVQTSASGPAVAVEVLYWFSPVFPCYCQASI